MIVKKIIFVEMIMGIVKVVILKNAIKWPPLENLWVTLAEYRILL